MACNCGSLSFSGTGDLEEEILFELNDFWHISIFTLPYEALKEAQSLQAAGWTIADIAELLVEDGWV